MIRYYIGIVLVLLLTLITSCTKNDDIQRDLAEVKLIETYLTSNDYKHESFGGVYRVEAQKPLEGDPVLAIGDSLYMNYSIYTFNGKPGTLVDTNIDSVATLAGLSKEFLTFEPKAIKYGTTPMINGLNTGLIGVTAGLETYFIIIPSRYGYGAVWNGDVPPHTVLFVTVDVLKIVNEK